jgi:hypothetical protein
MPAFAGTHSARHPPTTQSERGGSVRFTNIVYFNEPAAGGNFFALEQPDTRAADIRATFAILNQLLGVCSLATRFATHHWRDFGHVQLQ